MKLEIRDDGPTLVRLTLTGRLDAMGTEDVEATFALACNRPQRDALVDLSGVSFVGSLGIRMLMGAARSLDRRGRRLVILGPQPAVAEVFRTVALDELIPVLADEAAALARLGR